MADELERLQEQSKLLEKQRKINEDAERSLDAVGDAFLRASKDADTFGNSLDKLQITKHINAIKKQISDFRNKFSKIGINVENTKEIKDLIDLLDDLTVAQEKGGFSGEVLGKKIKVMQDSLNNASGPCNKAAKNLEAIEEQLDNVRERTQQFADAQLKLNKTIASSKFSNAADALNKVSSASAGTTDLINTLAASVTSTAGKIVIFGAAGVIATRKLADIGKTARESIQTFNDYQITLENVSRTSYVSPGGVAELEGLRGVLGTTRTEFKGFQGSLEALGKVGFQIGDIESVAQNVVKQFGQGSEAQKALADFTELLISFPTLKEDLSLTASVDDKASALYALAKQGKVDVAIKAGLFGGVEQPTEATNMATTLAESKVVAENIDKKMADIYGVMKPILPSLTAAGKYLEIIVGTTAGLSGLLVSINTTIAGLTRINTSGGGMTAPVTAGGKTGASVKGVSYVSSALAPVASNVSVSATDKGIALFNKVANIAAKGMIAVGGAIAIYDAGMALYNTDVGEAAIKANGLVKSLGDMGESTMSYQERVDNAADLASNDATRFEAAAKANITDLGALTSTVWETGGGLAKLTGELALGGALIGSVIPGLGTAVGAAAGAVTGFAIGLGTSLIKIGFGANELETVQKEQKKAAEDELTARMKFAGEVDRTKYIEFLQKASKFLKKNREIERKEALRFQAVIQRLDAVSKSAAYSLQDMQASIAETSMELKTSFGGTSLDFFKDVGNFAIASGKRMARAIDDMTNVIAGASTGDLSPEKLTMAFQEFDKVVLDEQKKFASAMDRLIGTIGNTPDVIKARLERSMQGVGQDIAEAFGTSLSAVELTSQLFKKAAAGIEQLSKTAEDGSKTNIEVARAVADAKKSAETQKKVGITATMGIDQTGLQKITGNEKISKEILSVLEKLRSGVEVENLSEISDKFKPFAEKVQEKANKIKAAQDVSRTLTTGFAMGGAEHSTSVLRADKEKEERKLAELNTAGGDVGKLTRGEEGKESFGRDLESVKKKIGGESGWGGVTKEIEKNINDLEEKIAKSTLSEKEFEDNYQKYLEDLAKGFEAIGNVYVAKKIRSYAVKGIKGFNDIETGIKDGLTTFSSAFNNDYGGLIKNANKEANVAARVITATSDKKADFSIVMLRAASVYIEKVKEAFLQLAGDLNKIIETKSQKVIEAGVMLNFSEAIGGIGSAYGISMAAMSDITDKTQKDVTESTKNLYERINAYREGMSKLNETAGKIQKDSSFKDILVDTKLKPEDMLKKIQEWGKKNVEPMFENADVEMIKILSDAARKTGGTIDKKTLKSALRIGVTKAQTENVGKLSMLFDKLNQSINNITGSAERLKLDMVTDQINSLMSSAMEGFRKFDPAWGKKMQDLANKRFLTEIAAAKKASNENIIGIDREIAARKIAVKTMTGNDKVKTEKEILELEKKRAVAVEDINKKIIESDNKLRKESYDAAVLEYEYKSKMVDAQKEMADIQLGVLEDMGAPFDLVLQKQAEIVGFAKQELDIQRAKMASVEELAKKGKVDELVITNQRKNVMKAEADLMKKTVQAQRSSIEKLLGAAVGELGKIGVFKRGTKAQRFGAGYVEGPGGVIVRGGAVTKEAQAMKTQLAMFGAGKTTSEDQLSATDNVADEVKKVREEVGRLIDVITGYDVATPPQNVPMITPGGAQVLPSPMDRLRSPATIVNPDVSVPARMGVPPVQFSPVTPVRPERREEEKKQITPEAGQTTMNPVEQVRNPLFAKFTDEQMNVLFDVVNEAVISGFTTSIRGA